MRVFLLIAALAALSALVYVSGIGESLFTRDRLTANEWRLVSFYENDRPIAHLPDAMRYCELRFSPASYRIASHCGRRVAKSYWIEGDRIVSSELEDPDSTGWGGAVSYSCSPIAEDCLGLLSREMRFELGARFLKIYYANGERFALFEPGEGKVSMLTFEYLLAVLLDGFGVDMMRSYLS